MMSHYSFTITKSITVTVEAPSETVARDIVLDDIGDGEYSEFFDQAIPQLNLFAVSAL